MTKRKVHTPSQPPQFTDRCEQLADIIALICERPNDEPVLRAALERLQPFVPFSGATVYARNAADGSLSCLAGFGVMIAPVSSETDESDKVKSRAEVQRPIIMAPLEAEENVMDVPPCAEIMRVPLFAGSRHVGELVLGAEEAGRFRPEHMELMYLFGTCLALAMDRTQLASRTQRIERECIHTHKHVRQLHRLLDRQERLVAIRKLAAAINHEINNPLTVIVGNVQFLRLTKSQLSLQQDERMEKIEKAAMRISDINQKLLHMDLLLREVVGEQANEETGVSAAEATDV